MSSAIAHGTDIPGVTEKHNLQYISDNVDHNVCTLDGKLVMERFMGWVQLHQLH